jgi:hypothetical protein
MISCYATFDAVCRMDRGGAVENSDTSPSAIVGCAKAVSASRKYESPGNIAVWTTAMTNRSG